MSLGELNLSQYHDSIWKPSEEHMKFVRSTNKRFLSEMELMLQDVFFHIKNDSNKTPLTLPDGSTLYDLKGTTIGCDSSNNSTIAGEPYIFTPATNPSRFGTKDTQLYYLAFLPLNKYAHYIKMSGIRGEMRLERWNVPVVDQRNGKLTLGVKGYSPKTNTKYQIITGLCSERPFIPESQGYPRDAFQFLPEMEWMDYQSISVMLERLKKGTIDSI